MGQIVGGAAKPKRCNLNKLSQLGTPAAGEYILVSSDNSMNAAGQGNFDCYIVGDGTTAATTLPLIKTYANDVDDEPTAESDNLVKSGGVATVNGSYTTNEEWIRIVTDSEGKILYGVKADGEFAFGVGVPQSIKDYVLSQKAEVDADVLAEKTRAMAAEQALSTAKVDKEEGKSLINSEYASAKDTIDNPEFLEITTDSEDKILEGIQKDGTKIIERDLRVGGDANINGDTSINGNSKIKGNSEVLGDADINGDAKILGDMEVSGVSYKSDESVEFIKIVTDANGNILYGVKADGEFVFGTGVPQSIKNYVLTQKNKVTADVLAERTRAMAAESALGTAISNEVERATTAEATKANSADVAAELATKVDKEEGKSLIDAEYASSQSTQENPEYLQVTTDSEDKVLAGRTADGAAFENVGFSTPKVSVDGATIENIEDIEGRTEIKTDDEGKIISYRDDDGVLHEEVGLSLSENALNSFVNDIKKNNPFLLGTDWSDYISHDGDKPLILPKPNCARINIIEENFNISSLLKEGVPGSIEGINYDVPTYIEFYDMEGNFFRKPIFISAQGQGSLYSAKKNLAIDLFDSEHDGDAFKIKFGDWIACDSFHLKGYYSDENKSRSVVAYQVYNDMVKTRGFFKDYVWKRGLIDENAITPTSTGLEDTDEYVDQMDNGARCFPDGFPVILYCNNEFYGLYVMLLKKDRANYKLSKKKAKNLWLDTVIYDIWNMNGNLDWRIFSSTKIDTMASLRGMEIRNPKDIYCVGFTYSYKILPDGQEKTAVINKPQYTSYDGDATVLTHDQIVAMNGGYPPAYLYNTATGVMYRIEQNPNGKYVKYNFDDPNKRSELIDETMSCYGKKKDGVTPLDPNNEDDAVMLANHKRSADVKKNMIALSKMYPDLQALDAAYEADKTSENLAAFKDKFEQCFDVDNLIDYQIICQLVYNWDSWGNNWLWFTYDGKKYFCGLYDCDASWGIGPGGAAVSPINYFIGQKMFVMMIKYYKERLVSRYTYLRDLKIIDRDSIMNKFLSFHHAWGSEYFEQEFKKWPLSTVKDSLGRIAKWIDTNIANMDALYINN